MSKKTNTGFFKIRSIKVLEFFINEGGLKDIEADNGKIEFSIKASVAVAESRKYIKVDLFVKIFTDSKENVIGKITTSHEFLLNDLLTENDNKKIEIPEPLMNNLVDISISTTRGILFEKTKGTVLQNSYLPLISESN